jgi:hypothetical protein
MYGAAIVLDAAFGLLAHTVRAMDAPLKRAPRTSVFHAPSPSRVASIADEPRHGLLRI